MRRTARNTPRTAALAAVLAAAALLVFPAREPSAAQRFEDDEACLACHQYPKMKRTDEDGTLRSFHVSADVFSVTVHRNVPCRDCHTGIRQIPHQPVTTGVNCADTCHSINNPATGRPFSHAAIVEPYMKSIHGRDKVATGFDARKPYCVYCHTNPPYDANRPVPPEEVVSRCVVCHENRDFAVRWYRHTGRRILEVHRTSEEVVALCSSCHGDPRMIDAAVIHAQQTGEELGRKFTDAVASYDRSFHGKLAGLGLADAANCLDCHADADDYYRSVHAILPSSNPAAPTSDDKRVATCKRCHTGAGPNYASLDPHPEEGAESWPWLKLFQEVYGFLTPIIIVSFIGLAMFETLGRRRDGIAWLLQMGSTWRRRSRRGRDRVLPGRPEEGDPEEQTR